MSDQFERQICGTKVDNSNSKSSILSLVADVKPKSKSVKNQDKKSIESHPYLNNQKLEKKKLNELNERITESKLSYQQKQFRKQYQQSKKTIVKYQKKSGSTTEKVYKPRIIDLNEDKHESKKQKKEIKIEHKILEKQNNKVAEGYNPLIIKRPLQKQQKTSTTKYEQDEYEKQVSDDEQLDSNHKARKLLDKMLGKYKTEEYRKRDALQIPKQSTIAEIDRQNKYSSYVAMKQQQEDLKLEQELKKRKHKRE